MVVLEVGNNATELLFNVDLADNEVLATAPEYEVRRITKLESQFNKVVRKYGLNTVQYVNSCIEQALSNPTTARINKAKTAILNIKLAGITKEEQDVLMLMGYNTEYLDPADYHYFDANEQ